MTDAVSLEQFKALDIRVGTVVSVDIVPEADKLLKLMVDVGEDAPRQIISGIREMIADPQELVGRQLLFIVNLAPRIIRGLESNGMLCAVGDADSFAFLVPHVPVHPGAKLR